MLKSCKKCPEKMAIQRDPARGFPALLHEMGCFWRIFAPLGHHFPPHKSQKSLRNLARLPDRNVALPDDYLSCRTKLNREIFGNFP
jgi:hypothetical protein